MGRVLRSGVVSERDKLIAWLEFVRHMAEVERIFLRGILRGEDASADSVLGREHLSMRSRRSISSQQDKAPECLSAFVGSCGTRLRSMHDTTDMLNYRANGPTHGTLSALS